MKGQTVTVPIKQLLAAALAATALAIVSPAPAPAASASCRGSHWVGSWAAAPSDGQGVNLVRPLAAQTVRMIVHPTLSGNTVRVRLSNRYGGSSARISSATIGVRAQGAAIKPGTLRTVTFGGRAGINLLAGRDFSSDAVRLRVRAGQDLVVSLHVPGLVPQPTEHYTTNQTNYLSVNGLGDASRSIDGGPFVLTTRTVFSNGWYLLSGVDVMAPQRTGAIVAFGDSITDGFQGSSTPPLEGFTGLDANARYPDFLARRLKGRLAVLNSGISGNRVLADAPAPYPYGISALRRIAADGTNLPGVSDVIILEGINDLGGSPDVTAATVIRGLRRLVSAVQRRGLRVHLGTLTPALEATGVHGTSQTDARRRAINTWIRHSKIRFVDFDKALRDPKQPSRLLPAYDSGDHLHPSSAGYRAMAKAIKLTHLLGTRC